MIIGFDVDGVLADIIAPALEIVNERWALDLRYEDATWGAWGPVSGTNVLKVLDEVWVERLVKPMEPMLDGSLRSLRKAGHEVIIITKRTDASRIAMLEWLRAEGLEYDALVFAGRTSKLKFPIEVLIDDHPEIGWMARQWPDKKVAVRDQPWNRGCLLANNAYRVGSVVEFVKDIVEAGLGSE